MAAGAGVGFARGTFGELLQGSLDSGLPFLVTFPIRAGTTAYFTGDAPGDGVNVMPTGKVKSRRLAEEFLSALGLPVRGVLRLLSDLPEGKGMASSSADLVATARAIADYWRHPMPTSLVQRCMARIEPSDGVMFDDVVVFAHREARLLERLGRVPPAVVIGLDEGGQVDTIEYNHALSHRRRNGVYPRLLDDLREGFQRGDLAAVGRVATRSALLNQEYLHKRRLDDLLRISDECGGLGVITTHSGTCLGVLLDHTSAEFPRRLHEITSRLARFPEQLIVQASATTVLKEVSPWPAFSLTR